MEGETTKQASGVDPKQIDGLISIAPPPAREKTSRNPIAIPRRTRGEGVVIKGFQGRAPHHWADRAIRNPTPHRSRNWR